MAACPVLQVRDNPDVLHLEKALCHVSHRRAGREVP
eukprot:CAMPEP_0174363480 /NCGR_PEP_ID=MMETSP0811_2-20130205/69004_1 /TAXON_ID=73025 ORGANISM="Eutreptiella gymnastica-like, Strain CCMP1594" /NCGR_SAMPLE_ID=MMETSP0811_2 /ASSEMBLY_ACC=CAM_ASM_000667 /LENGTH=35 /DNA_ID= /DNA_START= /DNA_END= /DNA_ORIENTATION=